MLRDSVEAGTFEEVFFATPAKGETDTILRAARRALDAGRRLRRDARAEGRSLTGLEGQLAALTSGAVRVLEEILTLARLNAGRVYPSYDYLAEATSLGRATIARALHVLDAIGFIVRQRRFKRVEAQGPGPRYEQTSNVYRAHLPNRILRYLPRWMRPAPLPDDMLQREADRVEDTRAMLAGLDCRDLAHAVIVDGPLAKILAKLGAAVDDREREYHDDPQPLTNSYDPGFKRVGLAGQHPHLTASLGERTENHQHHAKTHGQECRLRRHMLPTGARGF
ncbi:helix-turn-helix domain-containing protein [Sphingomonas sp. RP10(2022)]|uniref:Helix-turn-helix domain-containing protein n=1 Tax=Sphingomonas liriopis TaxID=2949094 RepID=A0A9X2HYZ2_9SPHN|nr:helix-turn-helix domain-containing protein [Sphingomonas liriopis]MCP3736158.1 helix-turn-helix domain-containing protein [Sphingomonas liriopis]